MPSDCKAAATRAGHQAPASGRPAALETDIPRTFYYVAGNNRMELLMVKITAWEKSFQNVREHRDGTTCYFQTVHDDAGAPILHLSTWGSTNRPVQKPSQVLQLDEANARRLVQEIINVFGPGVVG